MNWRQYAAEWPLLVFTTMVESGGTTVVWTVANDLLEKNMFDIF